MKICFLTFDGFTDVDLFLPWDFMWRVKIPYGANYGGPWELKLCADTEFTRSYSGVDVRTPGTLEDLTDADAVFIVSGDGSRQKLADPAYMARIHLDPAKQLIAAIDGGVLFLAHMGLLDGKSATTYPTVFPELEAYGIKTVRKPIVIHGNIATGGGCLSTQDLCHWIVERLIGTDAADRVHRSFQRVEG